MDERSSFVLDASALLAYLHGEPGAEIVRDALADGAVINVVNYAEVLTRLSEAGEDPASAHRQLQRHGIVGGLLTIVPLNVEDAVAIAHLRASTRALGLSLGDRACLATAGKLDRPALTADRTWTTLDTPVPIHLIR